MSTVDRETALLEFDRFVEIWDIDGATENMNAEDKESFEKERERIVKAIENGHVTIDDDGAFRYALRFAKEGMLQELTLKVENASMLKMDEYKDRQSMHKLYAYVASLAGVAPRVISSIDPRDEKVIRSVALLFLGS